MYSTTSFLSFCTTKSLYFRYVLMWILNSEKVKSLVTELQNEEENQSSLWCTNNPYTDADTWNMSD